MPDVQEQTAVATAEKEKSFVFYRISKYDEEDSCRFDEKTVRYALSAWYKDIDRAMTRMKAGEKVNTPYAFYVAKSV